MLQQDGPFVYRLGRKIFILERLKLELIGVILFWAEIFQGIVFNVTREIGTVRFAIVVRSKCSPNLIEHRNHNLPVQFVPNKRPQIHTGRVGFGPPAGAWRPLSGLTDLSLSSSGSRLPILGLTSRLPVISPAVRSCPRLPGPSSLYLKDANL